MWPESKNQDNLTTLLFMDGNNMYTINLLLSYLYIFSILNLFYNQHMYTTKKKKKKKKRICDFNNHHILSSNSCKKNKNSRC
jgi:hypothetical protein